MVWKSSSVGGLMALPFPWWHPTPHPQHFKMTNSNKNHMICVLRLCVCVFLHHLCWVIGLWSVRTLAVVAVEAHNFCWDTCCVTITAEPDVTMKSDTGPPTPLWALKKTAAVRASLTKQVSKQSNPTKKHMRTKKRYFLRISLLSSSSPAFTHCSSSLREQWQGSVS